MRTLSTDLACQPKPLLLMSKTLFSDEICIHMMNNNLLDQYQGKKRKVQRISSPLPSRQSAVAIAMALTALSPFEIQALGLGRVAVLSPLGEPLRVEIEVSQINPEEAASLKASIPNPAVFRAAGVEFNPALTGATLTLRQRADGSSYLRLTGDKIVNEPFLDLILEAQWASGRLVRNYSLLFDPPNIRTPVPLVAGTPTFSPPVPASPATTVQEPRIAPTPTNTPKPDIPPAPPQAKPARPSPERKSTEAPMKLPDGSGRSMKVQTGDTAGRIAAANKPVGISLDQMLLALLRTNPDAFIHGNINRIKAGALIEIPTAEQASSIPANEARKLLSVESANFNEFRRKLADTAPAQAVPAAGRQAGGAVQPSVEEKKTTASSPDKLTLSKGAVKGGAPEAQIAKARQGQESSERVAELSKNISDLSRLQDKTAPAGAGTPASSPRTPAVTVGGVASAPKQPVAASAPAVAATTPAIVAASSVKTGTASVPAISASAAASAAKPSGAASAVPGGVASAPGAPATVTASATAPMASPTVPAASASPTAAPTTPTAATPTAATPTAASAPASAPLAAGTSASAPASAPLASGPASAPKPKPAAIPPPLPEPSLLDELLDNPILPAGAVGLLALLGGFAFYRSRQRKKASQVDSSFLESKLQPDSFFGSSGGQRIDTADEAPTGSSLAYSPSQLDAAGDVDPVAEADVYLAYGRDLQAEEILKEALKMNPTRIAIHGKLLEILAKRRDARAFEVLAGDVFKLSGGEGAEWERICEFGRDLEPENALYQPGGKPKNKDDLVSFAAPAAPVFAPSTIPVEPQADFAPSSMPVDLDLGDLDFASASSAPGSKPELTAPAARDNVSSAPIPLDVELSWDDLAQPAPTEPAAALQPAHPVTAARLASAAASAPAALDSGMIEFDLGSLSLDLDRSMPGDEAHQAATPTQGADADPLETKLALAQEFRSIGDSDGARALVEEVVASATGPLKAKAQRFLAELD